MSKRSKPVASAAVEQDTMDHIDGLALAWSERTGREVSRSEVIRTLLVRGTEGQPVDADVLARARAGERYRAAPKEKPQTQRLRVVSLDEEGDTSPRGFDLPEPAPSFCSIRGMQESRTAKSLTVVGLRCAA